MTITPWFITSAYMTNEYADAPAYAYMEITYELYQTIKKAQAFVTEMHGYSFTTFDYTPEWGNPKDGGDLPEPPSYDNLEIDEDVRIDSMELKVTENTIYWAGSIKHVDGEYYTDEISINVLDENFKVLNCNIDELPTLMDHCEHNSSEALIKERLKHDPKYDKPKQG